MEGMVSTQLATGFKFCFILQLGSEQAAEIMAILDPVRE